MYESKNLLYLLTILECIEKVSIYSRDINTADEFLWANDQMNTLNHPITVIFNT
jgi:hypothetical protein